MKENKNSIEFPNTEEQNIKKTKSQDINNEEDKNIINNDKNNKSLFENNNKNLFGEDNNKTSFGENKNNTPHDNKKSLFNDNSIFPLFENNITLFGEKNNQKNCDEDKNQILSKKRKISINSISDIEKEDNDDDEEEEEEDFDEEEKSKNNKVKKEKEKEVYEEEEDEYDLEKKVNEECEEVENNDDDEENGDNGNFFAKAFLGLRGKEKYYCKKENVPKPSQKLIENKVLKKFDIKCNSEIISLINLDEPFIFYGDINYVDIKELKSGNFLVLFLNKFYCINCKTFKFLNIDESLNKYFGLSSQFSYIEEINKELVGLISKNFVLIVQINDKEVKFFQEIEIKAEIIKSFPNENLIIINEYDEKKRLNTLYYYNIYDKNLKYQLKTKEEFNFQKFAIEKLDIKLFDYYNLITNIKKFKNGKIFFFTISAIPLKCYEGEDEMNVSITEIDSHLFLNVYLYENKELTIIYKINYSQHISFYYNILESEFGDFLKIWRDENLLINEKDETITFFHKNRARIVTINIGQKNAKRMKFEDSKKCLFDKQSNCFYIIRSDENLEFQKIMLYKMIEDQYFLIKIIHLPYFFNDFLLTKKGYLLGVAKNVLTIYSFYHHLARYAPTRTINTSLCLFNASV